MSVRNGRSATQFSPRVATPEDGPAIAALLKESYAALMAPSYDRDVLAAALSHMTDPSPLLLAGGTFFLAEDVGGHIVGCGGWSRKQPGTGKLVRGLAHIRQFGVHSGWIGRGVGRALYRWCEDAAQAAGARRLEVFASLNAVGFYAACGFDEIRRVELRMGEGTITAVVMAREI